MKRNAGSTCHKNLALSWCVVFRARNFLGIIPHNLQFNAKCHLKQIVLQIKTRNWNPCHFPKVTVAEHVKTQISHKLYNIPLKLFLKPKCYARLPCYFLLCICNPRTSRSTADAKLHSTHFKTRVRPFVAHLICNLFIMPELR